MRLAEELKQAKCRKSPEKFKEFVKDTFVAFAPNATDEDLLHEPLHAWSFCEHIRIRTNCPNLEDCVILRALTNGRKAGEI